MDAHHDGAVPGFAAPEMAHPGHADLAPLRAPAAHGVVKPTEEDASDAANVEGRVQAGRHCPIFEEPNNDDKQFATLQTHLALKGYSLSRSDASDGPMCFYVTRWRMARELREPAAVARSIDQVRGAHA